MSKKEKPAKTSGVPAKRTSLGVRLIALVVSPILFLLLFELILTGLGYGLSKRFFVPWRMGDQVVHVPNKHFCEHFVPESLSRTPEVTVLLPKPETQFRIFVLGGSAANGDPDSAYGFCRQLEVLLNDHADGRTFQVVNAAITSMNSLVARSIAKDCMRHDPDLFILYMGNNEVVGPYGPPTLSKALYKHKAVIDTSVALKKDIRVGQFMKNVLQAVGSRNRSAGAWQGMEAFLDSKIPLDHPKLQSCYRHLKTNIADIVQAAHDVGARSLLCTVPTNIASCAPFASEHRPDLSDTDLAQWNTLYADARQLQLAGDHGSALEGFEKARVLDDRYADLAYCMGQCLLALNRPDEAKAYLLRARDLDVLRFRADTSINQSIRDQATALAFRGASLLDLTGALEQANQGRPLGTACMLDHVHLNVSGNFHAARAAMKSIRSLFPAIGLKAATLPDDALYARCRARLLFDVQAEYKQAMVMYQRKIRPPFADQLDHDRELDAMRRELFERRRLAKQVKDVEARYVQAVSAAPEDSFLVRRYGDFLLRHRRKSEAIELYESVYAGHRYDGSLRSALAKAYASMGGHDKAMKLLTSDLGFEPHTESEALKTLGTYYVKQRRYPDAFRVYTRLNEVVPGQEDTLINLASAASYRGDTARALAALTEALEINPKSVSAMINMGNYHVKRDELEESLSWFERAAELDPYNYIPQFSRGMQRLKLGQVQEGMKYVTRSVHLKPDFVDGYKTLTQVYTEFNKTEPAEKFAALQALFSP